MSGVRDRLAGKITDAEALEYGSVILTLQDAQELFTLVTARSTEEPVAAQARIRDLEAQLTNLQTRHGFPQFRTWREQQARIEELEAALAAAGAQQYGIEFIPGEIREQGDLEMARAVLKAWSEISSRPEVEAARIVVRTAAGPWTEVRA